MRAPSFHPARVVAWCAVIAVLLVIAELLPEAVTVAFAGFAGVVLGTALSGMKAWIEARTPLGHRASLALVILGFLVVIAAYGTWVALYVWPRLGDLFDQIATSMDDLRRLLADLGLQSVSAALREPGEMMTENESIRRRVLGIFSSGVGAFVGLLLVLFIAIYTALAPHDYTDAALRLVPPERRDRMRRIAKLVAHDLRRWVAGRAFSAVIIGTAVGLAVWLLGVPLPLTLGVLAALLSFVPNVGAVLTLIPAGLLALTVSPTTALAVLGVYAAIQLVESYFLTPLIDEHAVEIPPALLLFTQALVGVLFGIAGVAMAAPLLAVGIVLTRELYVEDRLEG